MRFTLIIGIVILSVFIFQELTKRKLKKHAEEIETFIREAYAKSWGSGVGMKILGIHKLTGNERLKTPVYFVAIMANGKFISALSELILEKDSTNHRKLKEKEKMAFLESSPQYREKYDECMGNYKEYLK